MSLGEIYLIPTTLHEDEQALQAIPFYVAEAVKKCHVFFVENERTARRFLKKIWKEMIINNYQWHTIHKAEEEVKATFTGLLQKGKNIGIISEAGCPGVADPGQILVKSAQQLNAIIHPLVGPNSILLALMASGMNGQCFRFNGYLPVDVIDRKKAIKHLEAESLKQNCTQIFIETPYRNNQLLKDILQVCNSKTLLCLAVNITSATETIQTKSISQWQKMLPDLHKRLAIFLLQAG